MSIDKVQFPRIPENEGFSDGFNLPLVMENSPDHGAFLVNQPVPKCGAFAYIAIVSRPNKK